MSYYQLDNYDPSYHNNVDKMLTVNTIYTKNFLAKMTEMSTGSPSSKYEHQLTSALLRNIRNIMICIGKNFRFCNLRKRKDSNKKQLTLLKMCVSSLLCGPRADIWPLYAFLCKRFSLYIKVYRGWALQRSGPTDPPKENGRKYAPTVPVASKFRPGNTR